MTASRVSGFLLLGVAAVLGAFACGGGETSDDTPGGGTGTGAKGGTTAAGGTTGGTNATGGAGMSAGGTTGGTNATGGTGTGGTNPAVGGTTAAGGTGGTTGGTGGTTGGTAGAAGMGTGGTGTGGTSMGGMPGTGGTGVIGTCTITPTETASTVIPNVFTVGFTTDAPGVTEAHIDFGPTTAYGMTAPVDLAAMDKTLLLGMKPVLPNTTGEYHYQIVVKGSGGECKSADRPITTGPIKNGIPTTMITTKGDATKLYGGFVVTEFYGGGASGGGGGGPLSVIFDKDGDVVWWYDPKIGDLTRSRMSLDGKFMWIAHGNVPSGGGKMVKVAMDGTNPVDLSSKFTGLNHDFTIVDDGTGKDIVYFIAYGSGQCDDIKEYGVDGTVKTIMNIGSPFSGGACHANAIEYSKEDDTLIVSELDHDAYVKIKRTGEVVWVLGGGSDNDFTGDAATWDNEHNLHVLGANHILMFNNGAMNGGGSKAIELTLDPTAKTATKMWTYTASPGIQNDIMGDVQRLDNGNTLVTYSTKGVIHEVDSAGMLLQEWKWSLGAVLGYAIKRPTLYGVAPK